MAMHPYPSMSAGPEQVDLKFRFQINGVSDPDNVVGGAGLIDDISRASTGVFNVTISAEYRYTVAVGGHAQLWNDPTYMATITSYTASTGVLVVTVSDIDLAAGALAAADPTDNAWLSVHLTLCRRSAMAPTESI